MLKRTILFAAASLLSAVLCLVTANSTPDDVSPRVGELASQRIQLLEKRVEQLTELCKVGRISHFELIQPKLDLLQAKLEYAAENDQKIAIYKQIIEQLDTMVSVAEGNQRTGLNSYTDEVAKRRDAMYLKSERIRIQIEMEAFR